MRQVAAAAAARRRLSEGDHVIVRQLVATQINGNDASHSWQLRKHHCSFHRAGEHVDVIAKATFSGSTGASSECRCTALVCFLVYACWQPNMSRQRCCALSSASLLACTMASGADCAVSRALSVPCELAAAGGVTTGAADSSTALSSQRMAAALL